VGEESRAAAPLAPAALRAARLDARLAVYAQHAAAMAEEAAAAVAADPARAGAAAATRAAAAEHFLELQSEGAGADAPPFDALLSDALLELEHQAAVDLALRQRLVALREAVVRGAAWAREGGEGALALPAPPEGAESPDAPAPLRALERGLVEARADGVGGALAGHFPGRAARGSGDSASGAPSGAEGGAGRAPGGVDVTF
jgi:hypothetical protein